MIDEHITSAAAIAFCGDRPIATASIDLWSTCQCQFQVELLINWSWSKFALGVWLKRAVLIILFSLFLPCVRPFYILDRSEARPWEVLGCRFDACMLRPSSSSKTCQTLPALRSTSKWCIWTYYMASLYWHQPHQYPNYSKPLRLSGL